MERSQQQPPPPPPPPPTSAMLAQSTIEIERPKTLTSKELALAREAALEVMRANTPEEALRIFMQGWKHMQPVVKPDRVDRITLDVDEGETSKGL